MRSPTTGSLKERPRHNRYEGAVVQRDRSRSGRALASALAAVAAALLVMPAASAAGTVVDGAHFVFDFASAPEPDPAVWTKTGTLNPQPVEHVGLAIVDNSASGAGGNQLLYSHAFARLGPWGEHGPGDEAVLRADVLTPHVNDSSPTWSSHALGWRLILDDGTHRFALALARHPATRARLVRVEGAPGAQALGFPWDNDFHNTFEIAREADGDFVVTLTSGDSAATTPVVTATYAAASLPPSGGTPMFAWGSGNDGGSLSFWQEVHGEVTGEGPGPGPTYPWSGFNGAIDDPPTLNRVKAGAAVPAQFSLGGDRGLEIFASGYPKSAQVGCGASAPQDAVEETVSAGKSGLSYDTATDEYSYVWKTNKAWADSCRELILMLDDGSEHRALFKFK